jgi:hypothetical protein
MGPLAKTKAAARRLASPFAAAAERRRKLSLYTRPHENVDALRHLAEALEWLKRAQDHGDDRGVAYGADFVRGFLPSYPETTGYIICTFADLAPQFGDEYLQRAIEMADWEISVQLPCGAVMGGMYGSPHPQPAVFNTGMALLGWSRLLQQTHAARFALAGERAGAWLVSMQEPDGNWVRGNSPYANPSTTVYNVKAAWGLAEIGAATGNAPFIAAAVRNAEYALTKQLANGWFSSCCLDDADRPLLHTLAYTMQGLLGIGKLCGRADFIDAAARCAAAVVPLMSDDGFIPGRMRRDWSAAANWCCLTGTAQMSVIWSQLAVLSGDETYAAAAQKANGYLMRRHDITSARSHLRGGVAGSWPVYAPYGRFMVLNWATKFFADALWRQMN